MSEKRMYDCVIAGSCVLDVLCRPVDLNRPIGRGKLHPVEPLTVTAGGITSNAGITMSRMGMRTAVFSYVGDDAWGPVIREIYRREGVDDCALMTHPTGATSTTVAAVDGSGERSFFHCVGAPKLLDAAAFLDRLELFRGSRFLLLGYYSLMPNLDVDLAIVFEQVRAVGCRTALDAAGEGGSLAGGLDTVLPHLDVFVPSLSEARHQTGESDPRKIIDELRATGTKALLGVKLGGADGVLLSPADGQFIHVPSFRPPGEVIDTTGAGDSFYAGLLTGLIKGMSPQEAGRLGTATAACSVTALGGYAGGLDYAATAAIAGLG